MWLDIFFGCIWFGFFKSVFEYFVIGGDCIGDGDGVVLDI